MSRFLPTAALVLGSLALVSGAARAGDTWVGPYHSLEHARADGESVLPQLPEGSSYAINYFSEDPAGRGRGAGYYLLLYKPDAEPGDGLLGVPLPQVGPRGP